MAECNLWMLVLALVFGIWMSFVMYIIKNYGLSMFFVYVFLIVCWGAGAFYFLTLA